MDSRSPSPVIDVDAATGEILAGARDVDTRLPVAYDAEVRLPTIGGMPLFSLDRARELRAAIDTYEQEYLRDEHYTFFVSYMEGEYPKRKGFERRAQAESFALAHTDGMVQPRKRAVALDILAAPLGVMSEPAPEFDRDGGCRKHDGKHAVYTRGWRVSLSNGRSCVDRGTVATCEKITRAEDKVLWGNREEHDPQATAERRAYVRAMSHLLGFGDPAVYRPAGKGTAPPPPSVPENQPTTMAEKQEPPETPPPLEPPSVGGALTNADWSAFWTAMREHGLSREDVHEELGLPLDNGSLKAYVESTAGARASTPQDVLRDLREQFLHAPA